MKVGRKPKSQVQRALEGTGPARRAVAGNPITVDAPLEAPPFVLDDPTAHGEWIRIIDAMPDGYFDTRDMAILTIYVQAWSLAQQCLEDISANGLTGERGGKNPSLSVLRSAQSTLMACADRLGLSLADRDRISAPTKPTGSKFQGLLGQAVKG